MATTKYKFDIFKLIEQIDKHNYKYILNLTDEELRNIQPFTIQRYFSSAPSQSGLDLYHLLVAYDVNTGLWKCNEKKLNLLMMATAGTGRKEYHSWIKSPKTGVKIKTKSDEIPEIVADRFNLRDDEVELFLKLCSIKDIKDELKQRGCESESDKVK